MRESRGGFRRYLDHARSHMNRLTMSARVLALSLAMVACLTTARLVAQTAPKPDPALVNKLTNELKISPTQAIGGAGAIFGVAKSRMNPADFGKVAAAVPGMDGFLKAAPAGTGSGLDSLSSMVPGKAGSLVPLAGSFKSLGLSPSMATKFLPIMKDYISTKGGANVGSLFAGALK